MAIDFCLVYSPTYFFTSSAGLHSAVRHDSEACPIRETKQKVCVLDVRLCLQVSQSLCAHMCMLKLCALYFIALLCVCFCIFLFELGGTRAVLLNWVCLIFLCLWDWYFCFTKTCWSLFNPPHSVCTHQVFFYSPVCLTICLWEKKNRHSWNNRAKSECFWGSSYNLFVLVIYVTDHFCLASVFPSHMIYKQNMTHFTEATIFYSLGN